MIEFISNGVEFLMLSDFAEEPSFICLFERDLCLVSRAHYCFKRFSEYCFNSFPKK